MIVFAGHVVRSSCGGAQGGIVTVCLSRFIRAPALRWHGAFDPVIAAIMRSDISYTAVPCAAQLPTGAPAAAVA